MSSDTVMLHPEWERIDLLGACLNMIRQGKDVTSDMKSTLESLQASVLQLRQQMPWQSLIEKFHLHPLDQDILACTMAPQAQPRIGWMFQELQPGIVSHYPTPAIIQELLFLDGREAALLRDRLSPHAPLLGSGLLEKGEGGFFSPLQASNRVCSELLGWSTSHYALPGAVEIQVHASWDDLILPTACLRSLKEFLLWVSQHNQVVNEWGARVQGGPVALFAGPSGTGKSFAAEVLAHALGWPLFRVDLGMMVSKYIGETEKNMNALFDAAHGQPVVLLFDEADSLFGKRAEVKDARDRYANMEVSHLLSRMERHLGPCILTSNLRNNLDPAFARRFQAVVEFSRPDQQARAQIWQRHLPPEAPYDKDIDTAMLGRELNLTGGQIRNVALHAAFLASGDGEPIGYRHITRAVWSELAKEGREMMPSSLGGLASYLPRELFV